MPDLLKWLEDIAQMVAGDNTLIEKALLVAVPVVIILLIVLLSIMRAREEKLVKNQAQWAAAKRSEEIVKNIEHQKDDDNKKIKRAKAKKEAQKLVEKAKDSTNTLEGGTSEVEKEENTATEVFGALGISSEKAKQIDEENERKIINGYLQKSNTAPIRPVYSNTAEARREQKAELESDEIGEDAMTPAIVTDSAAPSEVKETQAQPLKVKPTALKRPTSARHKKRASSGSASKSDADVASDAADKTGDEAEEKKSAMHSAMRPEIGTSVQNAVVERPATVSDVKPDIMKVGEEAILPEAKVPVKGFAPKKGSQIKRKNNKINNNKKPADAAKEDAKLKEAEAAQSGQAPVVGAVEEDEHRPGTMTPEEIKEFEAKEAAKAEEIAKAAESEKAAEVEDRVEEVLKTEVKVEEPEKTEKAVEVSKAEGEADAEPAKSEELEKVEEAAKTESPEVKSEEPASPAKSTKPASSSNNKSKSSKSKKKSGKKKKKS